MLENIVGSVPDRIAVGAFDSQPALVQQFTSNVYFGNRTGRPASQSYAAKEDERETRACLEAPRLRLTETHSDSHLGE
jgi:hypothetical protein